MCAWIMFTLYTMVITAYSHSVLTLPITKCQVAMSIFVPTTTLGLSQIATIFISLGAIARERMGRLHTFDLMRM